MKDVIFNMVQSNVNGGLENVYFDYSRILHKDFKVICIISSEFVHLNKLKKIGLKIEILNIKGHYDILSVIKLFFLIKKYSPKLIIAHNGRTFSVVNLCNNLLKNKKFKTIAVNHGGNSKRLINFDYIITVAKHLEITLRKKFKNISKNRIFTIHNGIKINKNFEIKNKRQNKNFTLGILSRLSEEKNIITSIKAFKLFLKNVNDAKLIIAGTGPELKNLKEFIINNNLQNNISFIGHIENIEEFFGKIDLFIHAAKKESFGLVVLEAFNYYKPVIGANSEGLQEIIKDKFNGYLYSNPMSFENLYNMIYDFYFYKIKDRDKIIINAKKTLENNFSIEKTENHLLSLIKSFMK